MTPDEAKKQAALVDEIRELLKAAQTGDISAVALIAIGAHGGSVGRSHGADEHGVQMLGALHLLSEDISFRFRSAAAAQQAAMASAVQEAAKGGVN